MSNKRITDLTELTTPTTDDVFPVVDIATNTTTKVQLGNLPIPTSVTTALATKENTITPGTTAQYYRGDKSFQTLDKTAVGLGNVDNTSDSNKPVSTATQTALNAKQDTLVSGTNIKTINSTSLLGSGNITIAANPSGVSGAIQFSNGSAFASDAANLFWDDTNNRLGIGTNSPTQALDVNGNIKTTGDIYIQGDGKFLYSNTGGGSVSAGLYFRPSATALDIYTNGNLAATFGTSTRATIKGSGSTSATTSLLVQNSAASDLFKISDNGAVTVLGLAGSVGNPANFTSTNNDLSFRCSYYFRFVTTGDNKIIFGSGWDGTNTYAYNENRQVIGSSSIAASAVLQADSTTRGFLPPRMTTTQKNAIASPAAGLVVYDTTLAKLCVYTTTWETITSL